MSVPALIYFVGFNQHIATWTSRAVLLPPIGIAAVMDYYRQGHVNLYAARVIAVTVAAGGWVGAVIANHIVAPYLRLGFSVFVLLLGVYLVVGAVRHSVDPESPARQRCAAGDPPPSVFRLRWLAVFLLPEGQFRLVRVYAAGLTRERCARESWFSSRTPLRHHNPV